MPTAYTDLIPLIRAAIGDFGIRNAQGDVVQYSQDFHDDDISSVITLVMLRFLDYSGNGTEITPSLANDNDTGAVSYYAALFLALPGGTYSLDAPNLKYWVKTNVELLSNLLGQIKYYSDSGGNLASSIWGTLDQLYNEPVLVSNRIADAVGQV